MMTAPHSTPAALERRLVLLGWIHATLGYASSRELFDDAKRADEGFDAQGRSHIATLLTTRSSKMRLDRAALDRYDANIRAHLHAINAQRVAPITLRYFQYLALLAAEIFLDWRSNRPGEFLDTLNAFVQDRNYRKTPGAPEAPSFVASDLDKLAFWMATGSGKTLIMHVNILQYLHYHRTTPDTILLITPNEGLTEQHLTHFHASNIPAERFSLDRSERAFVDPRTVRAIEITKLVEEKRGRGASVPVEVFEGDNLILVDEGHKGSGGEAWRRYRDALGRTGFTFEYSATFGQALSAARNDALTEEYGKAIVFDYSYKYFYDDGYGKDFHILNLRDERAGEYSEQLMLGNLLAFAEQLLTFVEHGDALRPYQIERPLWVFVGSSVNAVYRERGKATSDVLAVVQFLHRFLGNEHGWAVEGIRRILAGQSGLTTPDGEDVFVGLFARFRNGERDAATLYRDIVAQVFHARASGALRVAEIRDSNGELGLKVSGADWYFGVISIGDPGTFRKLLAVNAPEVVVEHDVVAHAFFANINDVASPINVLVGAKKFMEGWDSWRVSSMGLLNIGRKEGSQIIQLFGRGVRLRGREQSLKRSSAISGDHPDALNLLETLNIFSVRANYMAQFRQYLEREGVDTSGYVELPLPIRISAPFLKRGLLIPQAPARRSFIAERDIVLTPDAAARVRVETAASIEVLRSDTGGATSTSTVTARTPQRLSPEQLALLDWERIALDVSAFVRSDHAYANFVVRPSALRTIAAREDCIELIADTATLHPASAQDAIVLHDAVLSALRKYVERYHAVHEKRWETDVMEYAKITKTHPVFRDYTLRIPRSERDLIEVLDDLIREGKRIYEQDIPQLATAYMDCHLFQPLLARDRSGRVTSEPQGLEESEQKFVAALRSYMEQGGQVRGRDVLLLRNATRGRGVGFFSSVGVYPDFILWILSGDAQHIVFLEPHGMLHEPHMSDRIRLHEHLAALTLVLAERCGKTNVTLDAFTISATPYAQLRDRWHTTYTREAFAQNEHVLFPDEGSQYLDTIFAA